MKSFLGFEGRFKFYFGVSPNDENIFSEIKPVERLDRLFFKESLLQFPHGIGRSHAATHSCSLVLMLVDARTLEVVPAKDDLSKLPSDQEWL